MVNDILDFSKLEVGEVKLTHQPFSLEALVSSTISIVQSNADAKSLDLLATLDPRLKLYNVGDLSRLRQVLLNLLGNAVKFTARGGVTLEVKKVRSTRKSELIRFSIVDSGPGISREGQQRLFQQFAQADASISREHGGTGLGLSICKSLVELMNGQIGHANNVDEGSTFWFEVELPTAKATDIGSQLSSERREICGANILLVEDLEMNQELACAILRRAGHSVTIANDGREAIETVRRNKFDLILMDIQMPRMDGVTATQCIRKLGGNAKDLQIVAMTANALPEQVIAYRKAGMDDHVAKPFKQENLHAAIDRALARTRAVVSIEPLKGMV